MIDEYYMVLSGRQRASIGPSADVLFIPELDVRFYSLTDVPYTSRPDQVFDEFRVVQRGRQRTSIGPPPECRSTSALDVRLTSALDVQRTSELDKM